MRIERAMPGAGKGWCVGPWNSDLPISVGYTNGGIDDPHARRRMTELHKVARGTSELRVGQETIALYPGAVTAIEPAEARAFLSYSPDYFLSSAHVPGLSGPEARLDKVNVPCSLLGL